MFYYTSIQTTKEQAEALLKKHLKPICGIRKVISSSFSFDDEDNVGFVTLKTFTGKKISYQLRSNQPCFVEFTGFGNIRYDISYPETLNTEMYGLLKEYGIEAQSRFWKGGDI